VGSNEWGSCLTSQTTAQPKPSSQAAESAINPFPNGSEWVRADFHLHTKADKEFEYDGEENAFPAACVDRLKQEGIGIGVITNHNKFDLDEFKALRRRARREGIGLLPGVELSVNDGANGVHTLAVFSDEWLADGQDYINQFLNVAFAGKIPAQYEQENGRSNDDLITTLKKLEGYNKDFFIVFAHVEAASGLWSELHGGRMQELAQHPLIQKYCLGFQKVRTHDKPDAKCRVKVQQWWGNHYPAEVEGSDPKSWMRSAEVRRAIFRSAISRSARSSARSPTLSTRSGRRGVISVKSILKLFSAANASLSAPRKACSARRETPLPPAT
jgi:hypothetical protein